MAAADAKAPPNDWKKKETLSGALIQILIVGAVLAAAVFFVYSRGNKKKEVSERLKEARIVAIKGNPADLKKAAAALEEIFAIDSSAPEALATAATVHTSLWLFHKEPGAEAKAKEYLERAEKADSRSDDRFGTRAEVIWATQGPQAASDFVEELRKKGASSPRVLLAQAQALKGLGQLKLARQVFAQAADKAWKDPDFNAVFGEALLDEGQPQQAVDALSKAVGASTDHYRSRLDLGLARVARKTAVKDAQEAAADIASKEAELSPGLKARLGALKAELYNLEAQYDEAVKAADQGLAANPDDVWALYAKARALGFKKDPGAAAAFDTLVAKAKTAPQFYFDGAMQLQSAGNTAAALALLDKYEGVFKPVTMDTADGKKEPFLDRDDRYWLTRGDVLKESGKPDDAMSMYDRAIAAKNLNLFKATYAKASIFMARKEFDKAAELLPSITPPDGTGQLPEAYMAMGDIFFSKKDWATGCQMYAFGLTKLKMASASREQLNGIVSDVDKKLRGAGQAAVAKLWLEEAKPLIQ